MNPLYDITPFFLPLAAKLVLFCRSGAKAQIRDVPLCNLLQILVRFSWFEGGSELSYNDVKVSKIFALSIEDTLPCIKLTDAQESLEATGHPFTPGSWTWFYGTWVNTQPSVKLSDISEANIRWWNQVGGKEGSLPTSIQLTVAKSDVGLLLRSVLDDPGDVPPPAIIIEDQRSLPSTLLAFRKVGYLIKNGYGRCTLMTMNFPCFFILELTILS